MQKQYEVRLNKTVQKLEYIVWFMYTPGILLAYEMCISCKNINIQRVYKVEEEHPPFVSPFEATKTVTPTIRLLVSDLYTNSTQKISFTGL